MCCSAFLSCTHSGIPLILSCTHCRKTSHTLILSYSHAHTAGRPLILSYSHAHTAGRPLILSYSHAHTAGRPLILSYSHAHTAGRPLILSYSHAHATGIPLILSYSHAHATEEYLSYSHTLILPCTHCRKTSHTLILPCTHCRKTSLRYAPWPHSLRNSPPTSHCGSATTPRPPSVPTTVLCENSCPPPWLTCAVICTLWQAWCPGCTAGTRAATWSWSWGTSRTIEGQSASVTEGQRVRVQVHFGYLQKIFNPPPQFSRLGILAIYMYMYALSRV